MREISTASIHGEAELFRRMNSLSLSRSKRIRTIRIRGTHVLFILVAICLFGYLAFRMGHFLLTWDRLEVKSFRLINPPNIETPVLNGILADYRGNILSLPAEKLRHRLLEMPQVKDVSVYRRLPDLVEIRFSLRKPVLQYQTRDGIWYYDEEGKRLYQAGALREDLITCRDLAEKDIIRVGSLTRELAPLRQSIEYLSYRKPYGLVIKLKGYQELFYPGDRDFTEKVKRYIRIRSMDVLAPYRIRVVDLRFSDRIYVEHEELKEVAAL